MWFDVTRFLIPNWLVGALLITYPLAVYWSPAPVDWKMALLGMAAVFAVGYVVFAMHWMGGGDIKLITACALWVGWRNLPEFLILVALLGGLFSLLVWGTRKALSYAGATPTLRLLRDGEPIPYGVAIAIGFLASMTSEKIGIIL